MPNKYVFLSTLSLRRATVTFNVIASRVYISIHALLAESDTNRRPIFFKSKSISIHALLAESDIMFVNLRVVDGSFLSTLSLRRATTNYDQGASNQQISIHALLAESDSTTTTIICTASKFLSTLSLRRATFRKHQFLAEHRISIHALLAESDCLRLALTPAQGNFYPRSPCGERQSGFIASGFSSFISIHALLAESDPSNLFIAARALLFLSTLSLRRATTGCHYR